MKNTRFSTLFLLLGFLGGSGWATAPEPQAYPRFSTLAELVFTAGSSSEILYTGSTSTELLSLLVWTIPPSVGVSETLQVLWTPWFDTSLQVEGFLPLVDGTMSDDDWNIQTGSGPLLSRVHSDSQSRMQAHWKGNLEAGVPVRTGAWEGKFLVGVGVHQLAWQSWNTAQVATEALTRLSSQIYLKGITTTFRQTWVLPRVGAEASWSGAPWGVVASVRGFPFAYETQTDVHILRGITFIDELWGGYFLELKAEVSWQLGSNLVLDVHTGYRLLAGLRGDELVSGSGSLTEEPLRYTRAAGANLEMFTLGVGFRINDR